MDKTLLPPDSFWSRLSRRLGRRPQASTAVERPAQFSMSAPVDDSPGWGSLTHRPHDYDPGRVFELYQDALTAWRKNPIAWRIIAITTDYVVGDRILLTSSHPKLRRFLSDFWSHPMNRLSLRLESMSDELARAGDLFIVLFRNDADGMSYIRFVTKDRIERIVTAENDWETELEYYETCEAGEPRRWLSAAHPEAETQPAVMLHYAVNRPLGALLGESDLTTMIPWLLRYSRMLEDRVRLHWAVRAFLWVVTVPTNKVREKQEQYRTPPEAGSIIVKDGSEEWQAVNPVLHAADAAHDLSAVRGMIDAGSGYPPHWRGETADANLATATAMQAPTERHLLRRQQYFTFVLEDLAYQAYQRAVQVGRQPRLGTADYARLFTVSAPDISRADNEALARSARELAGAFQTAFQALPGNEQRPSSPTLAKLLLRTVFKFAGEPQDDAVLDRILSECAALPTEQREDPTTP